MARLLIGFSSAFHQALPALLANFAVTPQARWRLAVC
jgi:hypothetical protein